MTQSLSIRMRSPRGTVASDRSGYVAAFGTSLLLGTFPDPGREPAAAVE